jgi:hypothetical protein
LVYCEDSSPEELKIAVKHALIISLSRLNVGGIKNLDFVNWVIEPLGGRLQSVEDCPAGGSINYCEYVFDLVPVSTTLKKWSRSLCGTPESGGTVLANYLNSCSNKTVWPGLLAAECIVRSLLHCNLKVVIRRT